MIKNIPFFVFPFSPSCVSLLFFFSVWLQTQLCCKYFLSCYFELQMTAPVMNQADSSVVPRGVERGVRRGTRSGPVLRWGS